MYNPVGKCDVYDNRLAVNKRRRNERECDSGEGEQGGEINFHII